MGKLSEEQRETIISKIKEIYKDTDLGKMTTLKALLIVFLTLKLTGFITWSWWWVLAPLWAGIAVQLVILVLLAIIMTIAYSMYNENETKE